MNTKRQLLTSVAAVLLAIFANTVWAFETYDAGCVDCHGGFREDNYISSQDGAAWGTSLMAGHRVFVGNVCEACHQPASPGVFLNSSANSTFSKSCVGCHGRDEDVTGNCTGLGGVQAECGSGAGLRKHHESKVGADTCYGCHGDDPTPVGENITPSYYGLDGIVMTDSCDGDSTESQFGATGLDNDGDGQRDASDSDCETQANTPPTQPGELSASMVTTSSATVQWGASSDPDNDPISYQVDYRRNGETPWSNGGVTSNTSQSLSDLDAEQSYDVQVTPNDGIADGPSRTAENLFQTEPMGEIFPINAGLNGNWYGGADRNYEGIQIEISTGDDSNLDLVATFYTYDTMGNQIFLLVIGDVSGDTAEVDVYIYVNGLWGDDFDPLLVEETLWGTGTIRAFSCEAMEMDLRPNETYKALGYTDLLMYVLVRLPGIVPAVPCPFENPN